MSLRWPSLFAVEVDDTDGGGHAGSSLFDEAHHLEDDFFLLDEKGVVVAAGFVVVGEDLDLGTCGDEAEDADARGGGVDIGSVGEDVENVVENSLHGDVRRVEA